MFLFWKIIEFDARGNISLSDGSGLAENAIIRSADMTSSLNINDKKKDILILGKRATDDIGHTMLTVEK